jgi:hypothetical protein
VARSSRIVEGALLPALMDLLFFSP